jgi:hypothetical protein
VRSVTDAAKKLLEQVLALPEEDRRWLRDKLLDRLPTENPQTEAAWAEEAVRRLERAERGEAKLLSYDEVRAHVQRALRDA